MINLEEHKKYVESHKMDMVPYSIAMQALEEVANVSTVEYEKDLELAMNELKETLNNLNLDD